MKTYLTELANRYGGFVIGGVIGAIVHRIRNKMSLRAFLGVIFISAFIGFCVGVTTRNYLHISDEVIYALCSIAGVFAKDILDQIEKTISFISPWVKKKIGLTKNECDNDEC